MGLDMYLETSIYLSKFDDENKYRMEKVRELFPEIAPTGNLDYVVLTFEAGHWGKANTIHQWFVDNVQDGKDDCDEYYVSRGKLEHLRNLCKLVLKKEVEPESALPVSDGFCFGSTEYNDSYYADVQRTIDIIDYALSLPDRYSFYYHSSW